MGADYSFELISIETYAPQFNGHNKIFRGSVVSPEVKVSKDQQDSPEHRRKVNLCLGGLD